MHSCIAQLWAEHLLRERGQWSSKELALFLPFPPCQHRSSARPPLHQYPDVEHGVWPPTGGLYSLCAAMGMNLTLHIIIILMINIKALPDSNLFFPECPRAAAAIFAADWDHCCCCFSSLLLWKTTSLLNKANKYRFISMPNDHCPPPDVPCKSEHHCNVLIYILLTSDLLHSQDISKINKQWKSLAHIHILIIQVLTISDLSPTTVPPMICSPSLVFWLIIRSLWWIIRLRLTGAVFA